MIKPNVGGIDRKIRIIAGLIIIVLAIFVFSQYFIPLTIVGLIVFFTGLFRFCGLYTIFGINTCKKD